MASNTSSSVSFVMSVAALEQCYQHVCNTVKIPCKAPSGMSYQMNLDNMKEKKALFSSNELSFATSTRSLPLGLEITFSATSEVNWTWPKNIDAAIEDDNSFFFTSSSNTSLLNVFGQEDGFDCVAVTAENIVGENYDTKVYLAKTFPVQRDYWKSLKSDSERRSFLYFTLNNVFKPECIDYSTDRLDTCFCPNLDITTDDKDMSEWKNRQLTKDVSVLKAGLKSSIQMDHRGGVVKGEADMRVLCMMGCPDSEEPEYHNVDFRKEESFIVIVERREAGVKTFLSIAWIQNDLAK